LSDDNHARDAKYSNGILNPDAYTPYSIVASLVILASILIATFATRSRIPYLVTNMDARRSALSAPCGMHFARS
jgi:hypothetical protein